MAEKQPQATVRHENPLMPDERLRQLYTAMVQARMTEKHLNRRGRSITMSGEEAARARPRIANVVASSAEVIRGALLGRTIGPIPGP